MAKERHSIEKLVLAFGFVIISMAFITPMHCESCSTIEYQCNSTKLCIPLKWRCDGQNDCEDKSDEDKFCHFTKRRICGHDWYRCDNGKCVRRKWTCDGEAECEDGSDERDCDPIAKGKRCNTSQFRCFNGKCIPDSYKCNGEIDCDDMSDELHCNRTTCKDFQCTTSLKCIPKNERCDLKFDCLDKTDEKGCPVNLNVFLTTSPRITITVSDDAKWTFNLTSNTDKFTILWQNSENKEIVRDTGKYNVFITQKNALVYEVVLQIRDILRTDQGHYPVQVILGTETPKLNTTLYLSVEASALVTIESKDHQVNFLANQTYNITCKVPHTSSPQWTFQSCNTMKNCSNPTKITETYREIVGHQIVSTLEFQAVNHGVFRCSIANSAGNDILSNQYSDVKKIRVVDFRGNDAIHIEEPEEAVDGESLSFTCAVSTLYQTREPQWYQVSANGTLTTVKTITSHSGYPIKITNYHSKWSYKSTLKFEHLRIPPPNRRTYRCKAQGPDTLQSTIYLNVLNTTKPEFIYTNLENQTTILTRGDTAEIICNVSGRPRPNVFWTWGRDIPIEETGLNYTLSDNKNVLIFNDIRDDAQGKLKCTARNSIWQGDEQMTASCLAFTEIIVKDGTLPEFTDTNLENETHSVTEGATFQLICNVTGRPKPKITWLWNNEAMPSWPLSLKYSVYQDDQILILQSIPGDAQGRYTCNAVNMQGKITTYADIIVMASEIGKIDLDMVIWIVTPIGTILGLLVIVFGALMLRYKWKQRKIFRFLNELSEKEFYEGAVENINPDLSVTDQAYLLPFQQTTWEIPRQDLKLGIPLGSGAFGLVLKAQAFGVVEGEESTTVAVKTVKGNADESHFKALMTELKIMAHLGKHLNIVNLVGACTKNLAKKKELLVVMEFCKHGSLQTYMLRNKKSFINQLDPKTDKIDPSIGMQNHGKANPAETSADSAGNQQVEASNGYLLDNHNEDYQRTDTTPIKSTDLLSWAFQVAKGMEYLSARKVLHGDLAARNVLLAENNIVKICDFGYARETFKNYNYKKDTKGVLLPIKWMAIESIYCGEFSSKSDCWSFGILIWEFFTLGNKPYPGMEVNENFCERINDGYRMEKPEYAPTSVYQIMKECWAYEPSERPTFSQLSDKLGELISKWVRDRILDMNEDYAKLNQNVGKSKEVDYLLRMGGNDFCADKSLEPNSSDTATAQRYQEVPTASSSQDTEPTCSISMETKRNSKCKFVRPRPAPPQRNM